MPFRPIIASRNDKAFYTTILAADDETVPFRTIPFIPTNTSLDSDLSLKLHELHETGNAVISLEKPCLSDSRFNLWLLFGVILGHGVLLFLLFFLWRSQLSQLGFSLAESTNNTKALKAYFIYAPQTQILPEEPPAAEAIIAAEAMTASPKPVVSTTTIELPATEPKKPTEKQVKQSINASALSSTEKPAEVLVKTQTKSTQSQTAATHQPQSLPQPQTEQPTTSSVSTSASIGLFTQGYFERQREQALDNLVIEQTNNYSRKSNLTEMSPDMEVLIVPNAEDFSGPTSLDLELDPNRIVRQGDTCYRIVKVGTPINPYAENLGFPFDCSGKKMNQEINDAIQAQLNKMMVKRPKS
ncbi:hypothetical protein HRJ35_13825 [Shewanella oneidensis MR-1]|uniref:Uncharacterized protein n=1 Tax=Shewanella oneidensis (strain ATCC 700550 / JCM 31522 / CIP 106686 / LMG 19005 / NCIMB 14063 / MR-1) TaxID=211586 RepID=Q8EED6_SHEON|nr:hypothetical protein [Shewanella oneidensis]AAN55480.1 uncharacterized protein SO_2446 [Shewanella oneidensis MR-1]MDX5995865.1 hypothetical protein [Shewanella oneidensis]MEE2027066.1 hypothetical protein [Shewanella oneidensis]QKG96978.1 hypothetical protein HRJ35_13825 [Shewanella oneidensis MR-1]